MLAAVLRQNPRFIAGMTSPMSTIFEAIENATGNRVETSIFVNEDQRQAMLQGIFQNYYQQAWGDKVIFDTSRMWNARLSLLFTLFPKAKVICCVREIGWILDSFERIYRRNNRKPSNIYAPGTATVYGRTGSLSLSSGVVGYSLDALREACASDESDRILLVDYEVMCKNPSIVIEQIYRFIDEPPFGHDFDKVEYSAGEFDRQLGVSGLHDVKGSIQWNPRETILPPDLFERFRNDNFWRTAEWLQQNLA